MKQGPLQIYAVRQMYPTSYSTHSSRLKWNIII